MRPPIEPPFLGVEDVLLALFARAGGLVFDVQGDDGEGFAGGGDGVEEEGGEGGEEVAVGGGGDEGLGEGYEGEGGEDGLRILRKGLEVGECLGEGEGWREQGGLVPW